MLLLRIVVFSESVLLVVVLTPDCILPILDSINRKSTTDTKMLDSLQIQHQGNLSSHSERLYSQGSLPSLLSFIPSWIGSGTLNVSGTSIERVAVASSTTSLFDFVSGADERFIAQTPEGTVLFDISGTANESVTKDFIGSGSITLESGVGITTYRRILDIKGCWFCILLWFWCHQIQFRSTRRNLPTHLWRRILRLQGFLCYSVSESNIASGWRTYSPRYRLHTSLWYRSEHWYRDRHVPLAWWWPQRRRNRSRHCYHKVLT